MKNKVKVLHIITRLDKGGSAENTFLTLKGLDKTRYELILMSGPVDDPQQDRSLQIQNLGIRFIVIPELKRNINPIADIRALIKICRHLKAEKAEILQAYKRREADAHRLCFHSPGRY